MGKSSADAPDVSGAAKEQGTQARILNAEQTRANRPNQSNAWGSTNWTTSQVKNPVTGLYENVWNQEETLNPMLQQSLDSQMAIGAGRSSLAEASMARAWEDQQNPMDFDQYGGPIQFNAEAGPQDFNYDMGNQRQVAEDAAYGRATARLDPQFAAREDSMRTQLRNQGLRAGDRAYDSAMENLGKERNDAYEMARLGSVGEGRTEQQLGFGQAAQQAGLNAQFQNQRYGQGAQTNQISNALRQQQVQEDLYKRDFNLSEVDRLLEGQMVQGGPPSTGGQTTTGQTGQTSGGGTVASKYLGGG